MDLNEIVLYLKKLLGKDIWILYVFGIIFTALLVDFIQKRILRNVRRRLESTRTLWDDAVFFAIQKPLSVLIWVLGFSLAAKVVKWDFVVPLRNLGVIIVVAWSLVRLITYVEQKIITRRLAEGIDIDRTTADAITQLLKISVTITAALVALQTMGFNISAVLAFGGIGGIAVGFAAKDLLANFFGALMLYLDRPFSVGDWIRSPDRNIEGTVEKIGWRLTIIRTFDKRPLYVPNSVFSNIAVENPSRMDNRRIYETIGVRYADATVLPAIVAEVKKMLQAHPDIDAQQTLMVNFNAFAPSSLDFFIYTFTHTTDWIKFHAIKQDVLFRINEIISAHHAEVAYPTSTVHLPDTLQVTHSPAG